MVREQGSADGASPRWEMGTGRPWIPDTGASWGLPRHHPLELGLPRWEVAGRPPKSHEHLYQPANASQSGPGHAELTVDLRDLLHGAHGIGVGSLLHDLVRERIKLEERDRRWLQRGHSPSSVPEGSARVHQQLSLARETLRSIYGLPQAAEGA